MMAVMTGSKNVAAAAMTLGKLASDEVKEPKSTESIQDSSIAESGDAVSPMTPAEFAALADLEGKITDSWWHTGQSFAQIKELKLYRWSKNDRRQTWEEYCLDVHELTKQQVDKIIRAADVITQMKTETKVSVFPGTVSQAVELKGLTPKEMVTATANAIQKAANANRKPTANDYKQAAADCKPAKTGKVSVPVHVSAKSPSSRAVSKLAKLAQQVYELLGDIEGLDWSKENRSQWNVATQAMKKAISSVTAKSRDGFTNTRLKAKSKWTLEKGAKTKRKPATLQTPNVSSQSVSAEHSGMSQ